MYGDMQPQAQVQILVNIIDFGMNLQEAGDAPRVRHYGSTPPYVKRPMENGGEVWLESGFSPETINQLLRMGHQVKSHNGGFGGYQAIMRDHKKGVYFGASDPRKDGQAIGY
jgi:gamma-glutamyltranspeptidase/glutathione hydrolase